MKRYFSLSRKLFLIVLVITSFVVTSYIIWTQRNTKRILLMQKSEDLSQILDSFVPYLSLYTENLVTSLMNLATTLEICGDDMDLLEKTLEEYQSENAVRILDAACVLPDGRVVSSVQYLYEIFGSPLFTDCFETARDSPFGGIRWTEPYQSQLKLKDTIALFKPLTIEGQRAVVIVEIDLSAMFEKFFNKSRTIYWAIFSGNENLIVTNINDNYRLGYIGTPALHYPEVPAEPSLLYEYDFRGTTYLARQNRMDTTGWTILGLVYAEELNESVEQLIKVLGISGIVSLFLLTTMISFVVRSFTISVTHMAKAVARAPSPLILDLRKELRRNDEIGILAQSLQDQTARINSLIEQKEEVSRQRRRLEIEMLQRQIHPHFLGNTLSCLISLINVDQAQRAKQALQSLIKLMNYSINRTDGLAHLSDELECAKAYMDLRMMRSQDRFEYEILVPTKYYGHPVPRLILQPIIENAVVHGFCDISEKGKIVLIAYEKKGKLFICIDDNGSGMEREKIDILLGHREPGPDEKRGIGVSNVFSRLSLHYPASTESTIELKPDRGVRVILDMGDYPAQDVRQ